MCPWRLFLDSESKYLPVSSYRSTQPPAYLFTSISGQVPPGSVTAMLLDSSTIRTSPRPQTLQLLGVLDIHPGL